MRLDRLWLRDLRAYAEAELALAPGLTAIVGPNGAGKTTILEAIGWLATMSSFRGVANEALVRQGASAGYVRARVERDGREHMIEAEIPVAGRSRVQVDGKRVRRGRDLLGQLRVVVFTPDDLELVKGGPGGRRRFLDDLLVQLHPRHDQERADLERVLRQRNALLRQAGGRLTPEVRATLDVWDEKLAQTGEALAASRASLVADLGPKVAAAYGELAPDSGALVELSVQASWDGPLAEALAAARDEDVRRGATTVGPQRDDLLVVLDGRPARAHASQGEQRCLALALRLASRQVILGRTATDPILLLDDVLSELDPVRSAALLEILPGTQTVLTSASGVPAGTSPELVLEIRGGAVHALTP